MEKQSFLSGWEWNWECHDLSNTGSQQSYTHIVLGLGLQPQPEAQGRRIYQYVFPTNHLLLDVSMCWDDDFLQLLVVHDVLEDKEDRLTEYENLQ